MFTVVVFTPLNAEQVDVLIPPSKTGSLNTLRDSKGNWAWAITLFLRKPGKPPPGEKDAKGFVFKSTAHETLGI